MTLNDIKIGMVFERTPEGGALTTWEVVRPDLTSVRGNRFFCAPVDEPSSERLLCFAPVFSAEECNLRWPNWLTQRSAEEWASLFDQKERELMRVRSLVDESNHFAQAYEKALEEIAKLCGHQPNATNSGFPEGVEITALRLVKELVEGKAAA